MDFGGVLDMLKSGHRVFRANWNGVGMWVGLERGMWLDPGSPFAQMQSRPFLFMKTVNDELVPWVASQTDLLASDWLVAS